MRLSENENKQLEMPFMKKRELDAAKLFPQSKVRQLVLEDAMNAIAGILLVMLGELECTLEEAAVAVVKLKLLLEVLNHDDE